MRREMGIQGSVLFLVLVGCASGQISGYRAQEPGGISAAPVIDRFTAAPASVASGQSSILTWSVAGADSLSVDPGIGLVNGTSVQVSPTASTTYTLSAVNSAGTATAVVSVLVAGSVYTLPPDRATLWRPGVTYNGGIPTDRTQCGATLSPNGTQDDGTAIQAAIDACTANHFVKLGPGTFNITGESLSITKDNITLRGSGAGVTILHRTDGASDGSYIPNAQKPVLWVGPNRWPWNGETIYAFASDGVDGDYSVQLATAPAAGIPTGTIVVIDELSGATWITDPNGRGQIYASPDYKVTYQWHNPPQGTDDPRLDAYSHADRPTQEVKEVASYDAATRTVTFSSPFHTVYRASHAAQLTVLAEMDKHLRGVGVESMTLERGDADLLQFQNVAYSWVKNIEATKWRGAGVLFFKSFRCELRDSYIHTPVYFEPGGGSYNIALDTGSSEILIENNVSVDADKVMVARTAGAGSVVGYNYMDDGHIGGNPDWMEIGVNGSHMVGCHHMLFEGNYGFNGDNDKTHGNSNTHTYFRNHLSGRRLTYGMGNRAAGATATTTYMSFVGNVLGLPGQMSGWEYQSGMMSNAAIWLLGWDDWAPYPTDPVVEQTTLRDGNFDYVTNSQRWHGIGGAVGDGIAAPLPDSMYLTTKPAFFGTNPWPWVNPAGVSDSERIKVLPAKARFDAGTPNIVP